MGNKSLFKGPYDDLPAEDKKLITFKVSAEDYKTVFDNFGGGLYGMNQFILSHVFRKLANKIRQNGRDKFDIENISTFPRLLNGLQFGDPKGDANGQPRAKHKRRTAAIPPGSAGPRDDAGRDGQVLPARPDIIGLASDFEGGSGEGSGDVGSEVRKS